MARIKQLSKRGFTLVELMIVVVIIGILAALAIYGVQKYVSNSKSAEARLAVGRISKDAASAWEGERMAGNKLGLGSVAGTSRSLCASATGTIPATVQVEGQKYQPDNTVTAGVGSDFSAGDQNTGWKCLQFAMDTPIYFAYSYQTDATNFTAGGQADFGGVGKYIFQNGAVQSGQMTIAPSLCESEKAGGTVGAATGVAITDYDGDCSPF